MSGLESTGVHAIIPVKPLARAKSRLRDVLAPEERALLALGMLDRVVSAALATPRVAKVSVLTSDSRAATAAVSLGADTILDQGVDLNSALTLALSLHAPASAGGLAILQGDLPWLTPEALDVFLAKLDAPVCAAVAADQHGSGTSAFAWRGSPVPEMRFGCDSFALHGHATESAGLTLRAHAPSLAFHDVDELEDIERFARDGLFAFPISMPTRRPS